MKKRMFVFTNLDGDELYYSNIEDALGIMKIEANQMSDEMIEDFKDVPFELTVKLMTDEEIAALPEY
jgi:hypothetical protein